MNLISLSLKTVGTKYVSKSILLPNKQRYQKSYGYTTSRNNGVFKVWRHFCSLSSICIVLYCRQRESARGDGDERPWFRQRFSKNSTAQLPCSDQESRRQVYSHH